jgi:hypothetical protein
LFAITDDVSGSLFSVTTGSSTLFEIFSNGDITLGNSASLSLYTTDKTSIVSTGITTIHSIPTDSYNSVHVEYNCISASNGRAGMFTAFWIGSTLQFNEFTTVDVGSTSNLTLSGSISGGNFNLQASASSTNWVIKSIIRGI